MIKVIIVAGILINPSMISTMYDVEYGILKVKNRCVINVAGATAGTSSGVLSVNYDGTCEEFLEYAEKTLKEQK